MIINTLITRLLSREFRVKHTETVFRFRREEIQVTIKQYLGRVSSQKKKDEEKKDMDELSHKTVKCVKGCKIVETLQ